MMKTLSEIFDMRLIKVGLNGKTKDMVMIELIDSIAALHPECSRAELFSSIIEREKKMSTGIGDGIAIPHAPCRGIEDMVGAIGVSTDGIDYGALDNKPVHIVFLLAMKQQADENHLRILNLISNLAHSEAFALIKSSNNEAEIHEILSKLR